jgi:hypothetical protein
LPHERPSFAAQDGLEAIGGKSMPLSFVGYNEKIAKDSLMSADLERCTEAISAS